MLIKNNQDEERSQDQRRLALQQVHDHQEAEQPQLYISKFKPDGTSAYQQPPSSKGSTKFGALRGAYPQEVKVNEFGCLIGVGSAA